MVLRTAIDKTAGNRQDRARGGAHIKCECHGVLDVHSALDKCLNGLFLWL